jgi:hypothetical protein
MRAMCPAYFVYSFPVVVRCVSGINLLTSEVLDWKYLDGQQQRETLQTHTSPDDAYKGMLFKNINPIIQRTQGYRTQGSTNKKLTVLFGETHEGSVKLNHIHHMAFLKAGFSFTNDIAQSVPQRMSVFYRRPDHLAPAAKVCFPPLVSIDTNGPNRTLTPTSRCCGRSPHCRHSPRARNQRLLELPLRHGNHWQGEVL